MTLFKSTGVIEIAASAFSLIFSGLAGVVTVDFSEGDSGGSFFSRGTFGCFCWATLGR